MSRAHDEQAIALAGMFQVATLVDQVATKGMMPQNSFESSLYSLFVMNPATTEDVFGGRRDLPHNLSTGLNTMISLLEKKEPNDSRNIANYVLSMIVLQGKLMKRPEMVDQITKRLDAIVDKVKYFHPDVENPLEHPECFTHPSIVANIASLYQETISTFSYRIQVGGDQRHLQNSENAAKIRALLLAGIRAAILWRQVGGKRWHLFFFKSRLRPSLKAIKGKNSS
jgi:high frequency lysogenization protein